MMILLSETMYWECIFFKISHDAMGFCTGFGNPGGRNEGVRVPKRCAFDGSGGTPPHLAKVITLRFGIVKH